MKEAEEQMGMRKAKDLVFYPEYFDINLSRAEGRRLSKKIAIKAPRLKELYIAAKRANLEAVLDESKSYSRRWWENRGAITITKIDAKTSVLNTLGKSLREVRIELLRKKKDMLATSKKKKKKKVYTSKKRR